MIIARQGIRTTSCYPMVGLFLAVLFLCVNGWASCNAYTGGSTGCSECNCNFGRVVCDGGPTKVNGWCGEGSLCAFCPTGTQCSGGYIPGCGTWWYMSNCKLCSNNCEADSLRCINEGEGFVWVPSQVEGECGECQLDTCDAKCQCEEDGGTWSESNGGYCVPDCKDKTCCEELNRDLPVETETNFLGCIAEDPSNDRCVAYQSSMTGADTTVAAECNGLSQYERCTLQYIWGSGKNSDGKQCYPIPSYNCSKFTQRDSNCTNVICTAYQQHAISNLNYNRSKGCYEGTETVNNMLTCSNGNVQSRGSYTRPFIVCDSYLDSLGTNISDYLAGSTGAGPGTGIAGGTGGGSGGGSGGSDGCIGNGCGGNGMPSGWEGGTSTDNEGNEIQNSGSPGLGGYTTPTPEVVTQYDSTTGTTTIVKNSQGGDSVRTTEKFFELQCLGVSGGVATLTNGVSTWTCPDVMSCGQALISARLNGGACSAGSNGIDPYSSDKSSNLSYSVDSLQTGNEFIDLENAMNALAAVMNGIAHKDTLHREKVHRLDRDQQDSLWKATFGQDLDAVRNMENYIASASSANSAAISAAASSIASANSNAVSAASSNISTSIANASSDIRSAIGRTRDTVHHTNELIEQGFSASSHAISAASFNISGAVTSAGSVVKQSVDNLRGSYLDSVQHTNQLLEFINFAIDTTGIINRDLIGIKDAIGDLPDLYGDVYAVTLDDWYNDKLKITMDANAQKVADAIDSLKVEVKLDSLTQLDTINDNLKKVTAQFERNAVFDPRVSDDSLNFGHIMAYAYDSTTGDTVLLLDSSFIDTMISRAGETSLGVDNFDDSVMATLQARFDSARQVMDLRSDTAVMAYYDSLRKYSGIDTMGKAMTQFFSTGSTGCPRDCLTITVQPGKLTGNRPVVVDHLAVIFCDTVLFGSYTPIDFMKAILRILVSILCMFLIVEFLVPAQKGMPGRK